MTSILLKRFLKNTSGNFSMIGAVMLTSAVSIIGLGVDMQRNYAIKSSLQSAVDAAALSGALATTSLGDEATFGERRKAALSSLQSNTAHMEFTENPNVTINPLTGVVTVEASVKTDFLIMSLFGHENKTLSAQGKAAYDEAAGHSPELNNPDLNQPNEINAPTDKTPPLSIAFVLDNSTSLLEGFEGQGPDNIKALNRRNNGFILAANEDNEDDNNNNANNDISRLDLLKDTAGEFYASLDRMSQTNPQLRQTIRTALLPYNDGLDQRYQVGLRPGWTRTAAQTRNMQPNRRTLPVESFNMALRQLNSDRKTNENKARKVIVFMGDGDFDAGFEARPETERLLESCAAAKKDGVEIYVFTLDVSDNKSLNPYQICASPNGSISGYGPIQSAVDAACDQAVITADQDICRQRKTEYFSQITSPADLDRFWARLNPNRSPAPSPDAQARADEPQTREARVRLVK